RFRRLLFGPVQQETVLLMGERGPGLPTAVGPHRRAVTRLVELDDQRDLAGAVLDRAPPVRLPAGRAKWTRLWLSPRQRALPAAGLAYVAAAEQAGVHTGYKCRIRLPAWWHVPSVWSPDAFLLRQIHTAPRIVANPAGAVCTDTIHRLRARAGVGAAWLATAC